jgi:hypothetical protein
MRTFFLIAGLFVIAPPFIAVIAYWFFVRSQSLLVLEAWAKRDGYRIVRRSFRRFFRGPYSLYPNTQTVFYVTIEDGDGLSRNAWVCCGDQYFGTSDQTEVEWSSAE